MTNYKITELNSTFVHGELYRKFVQFRENEQSLVIEGVDTLEDKSQELKAYVWVLTEDNELFPKFEPIQSNGVVSAEDLALLKYGMDIIDIRPPYFKLTKTIKLLVDGQEIKITGTFKAIETSILSMFAHPITALQIVKKIEEFFSEQESTHSFMVDIPATKKHIVMGIL